MASGNWPQEIHWKTASMTRCIWIFHVRCSTVLRISSGFIWKLSIKSRIRWISIGLSSAGAAKANAYQNGITGFKAYVYAGIQGITSAYITKKFKAIPGLSDNTSTTIKGILKSMTQARYFSSSTKQNWFIHTSSIKWRRNKPRRILRPKTRC